eukprot:scaffold35845_cov77-Phaeocystis_antarctica.AAC.3
MTGSRTTVLLPARRSQNVRQWVWPRARHGEASVRRWGTRGRGRTRPGVLQKRSGQGGQALCRRGLRKGYAASWLALSGPFAWWHGAAGADLGCCVSGELLFCQGTVWEG